MRLCHHSCLCNLKSCCKTLCSGCLKYQIPGAYAQAIADLTTAIAIDRSCPLVYFNRALCFHTNRQYLEALRDYTTVLLFGTSDEDEWASQSGTGTAGASQVPTAPASAEGTPRGGGGGGTRGTTRASSVTAPSAASLVHQQRERASGYAPSDSTPHKENRVSGALESTRKESRFSALESSLANSLQRSSHQLSFELSPSRRFSGPVEPPGPTKEKLIIYKVLVYSNHLLTSSFSCMTNYDD